MIAETFYPKTLLGWLTSAAAGAGVIAMIATMIMGLQTKVSAEEEHERLTLFTATEVAKVRMELNQAIQISETTDKRLSISLVQSQIDDANYKLLSEDLTPVQMQFLTDNLKALHEVERCIRSGNCDDEL